MWAVWFISMDQRLYIALVGISVPMIQCQLHCLYGFGFF
ncbi:hypothetical protein JL2886_03193 [Phaeobacter gallaeciensis]|uniref:Uncharacterized protein n=1 Tax=Phaeobacter gallaeciensis TaxID=60890 RepID=A0A1B0ZVC8_9RHOB|nr:hypothetical protein JL2886_01534 [Phaeobacter gallaeciensis]ANP36816.1 hypothetical protein JL2886_01915 [Phaeobacter gallaeciensis]ANP36858.1 hypothetical protein JL2886_01963 [Phaeobacter gallaeciensis]ANP38079.1 hypothetical protein JL2886_03193 [Phaeobacter gallaeciensis]